MHQADYRTMFGYEKDEGFLTHIPVEHNVIAVFENDQSPGSDPEHWTRVTLKQGGDQQAHGEAEKAARQDK
jgi:hypothetical protein